MRSKFNYFLAFACAIMSLVLTYIILNADKSVYHWIVVAVMIYGSYQYYQKAEKTAE
mgnify:CR=1 FL=1